MVALIKRTIIVYCKAHFDLRLNPEAERLASLQNCAQSFPLTLSQSTTGDGA